MPEIASAVVETPEAMRAASEEQDWDVITLDHAMPFFSAPAALALAKELRPDVPFIIVRRNQSEPGRLADAGGAQDYIPKGELARLVPAIERELRDVEGGRKRQQVEDALQVSETRYRRLFETARDGILLVDAVTHHITDVNPFMVELLGYARAGTWSLSAMSIWKTAIRSFNATSATSPRARRPKPNSTRSTPTLNNACGTARANSKPSITNWRRSTRRSLMTCIRPCGRLMTSSRPCRRTTPAGSRPQACSSCSGFVRARSV
jgi:CheY-like chemotaxis protein